MTQTYISRSLIACTVLIVFLASLASLAGLHIGDPYALETQNWKLQAHGQDIGNIIAVVALLVSAVYASRGSIRAYLVWLGTLFYILYAYIIYAVAVHFNSLFLVYVAVVGLALYSLIFALAGHRPDIQIGSSAAKKLASITLIATGVMFGVLWLSEIIPAIITGEIPKSIQDAGLWVNPVHVLDLSTVIPAFMLTGYFIHRNHRWGIFYAVPWLMFSVLMGCSIIASMVLMVADGSRSIVPPMVLLSLVVLANLGALLKVVKHMRTP